MSTLLGRGKKRERLERCGGGRERERDRVGWVETSVDGKEPQQT